MKVVANKVFDFLNDIVVNVGYELVDVSYKKEYGIPTLTVYIWRKGGISLDDCEKVHNAISAPLDELNPTGEVAYHLNVSSPGLDRPIVTQRDYERNVDEEIELTFKEPFNGKKKINGKLISVSSDGEIILEIKNSVKYTIRKEIIATAKPYIKF